MHRPVPRALLSATCAWLGACGSSAPAGPPKIDDGVRLTYSLAEGSPDAAAQVMRRRLALAHVKGWASAQGDTIVVDLAGADDETLSATRALIARTANFQVRLVADDDPIMRRLAQTAGQDASAQAAAIGVDVDTWRAPAGEDHVDYYLHAADREDAVDVATARRLGCFRRDLTVDDGRVRCLVTGRFTIEQYLAAVAPIDPNLRLPDDHQLAFERIAPADDRRPFWRTYYVVRAPQLSSDAIADARPTVDRSTERSTVQITLRADAATAFAELTRAHVGHKLALVLDDRVMSAPIVMAPITGGRLTINLADDARPGDARELAIALASGPLPAPVFLETAAILEHGRVVAPPAE